MKKANRIMTLLMLVLAAFVLVLIIHSYWSRVVSSGTNGTVAEADDHDHEGHDHFDFGSQRLVTLNGVDTYLYSGEWGRNYFAVSEYIYKNIEKYTDVNDSVDINSIILCSRKNFDIELDMNNELFVVMQGDNDYRAFIEIEEHDNVEYVKVSNNETDRIEYYTIELEVYNNQEDKYTVIENKVQYEDIADKVIVISDTPNKYTDDRVYAEAFAESIKDENGNLPYDEATGEPMTIDTIVESLSTV